MCCFDINKSFLRYFFNCNLFVLYILKIKILSFGHLSFLSKHSPWFEKITTEYFIHQLKILFLLPIRKCHQIITFNGNFVLSINF